MSSANRDILTVSLPICIPSRASFCLVFKDMEISILLSKWYLTSWSQRNSRPFKSEAWWVHFHYPGKCMHSFGHRVIFTWQLLGKWYHFRVLVFFQVSFIYFIFMLTLPIYSLSPGKLECHWLISVW
jgi:hypothetical protein